MYLIVRMALLQAPENIGTLIKVISSRLFNLVIDHTFPSPINFSMSSFIRSTTGLLERNTTKEVLNCLRILQRVLPVIFEADGETNTFEMGVIWKATPISQEAQENVETRENSQFVIEDEDGDDSEDSERHSIPVQEGPKGPSLGEKLLRCLIDLMFCCGFTLPVKCQVGHHKINHMIWCAITFVMKGFL